MTTSRNIFFCYFLLVAAVVCPSPTTGANGFPFFIHDNEEDFSTHPSSDKDVYQYLDGICSVTTVDSDIHRQHHRSSTTIQSFGYSDYLPQKIPMTSDARFPIASNSKLFTAVAIYQLHEQGKLDVDADIATLLDVHDFEAFGLDPHKFTRFCPQVIAGAKYSFRNNKCEKITLRNLLSMSSGIYPALNCDSDATSPGQCNPDPYIVSRGSIARTVGTFITQPLIFQPGTQFHYSNPNFILATYFVEKYSTMTFSDYLQQNIFSRIGLNDTYFDFYNEAMVADPKRVGQYIKYYDNTSANKPYEMISLGRQRLQLDLGVAAGTGGIVSTAQDYATFWYALFNKTTLGAPLVSKASQKAILFPWTLDQCVDQWVYPNGTKHPAWIYYTQGTSIVCEAQDCPDGPRWIMYEGGDPSVTTGNVLDYVTFRMAQVWTNTLVAMTSRQDFDTAVHSQTGFPASVISPWLLPLYNNPLLLAWHKLYGKKDTRSADSNLHSEGYSAF